MIKNQKLIKELQHELDARGIKSRLEERSKHRMLHWEANGVKQSYTFSRSPSDRRSTIACVTGIRRLLRQAGIK